MGERDRGAAGRGRRTLVYRGPSMSPTFRDLDVLSIRSDGPLRVGDVIAYASPGRERITVHRIVRCSPGGFVTRGDNGPPDRHPVPPSAVLGRVEAVNRDGAVRTVRGGRSGLAYAMGCHARRRLRAIAAAIAGPAYRRLVG